MKSSKKLLVASSCSSSSGTTPITAGVNSNSVTTTTANPIPNRIYFGSKVKSKKKLSILKKRILRERLQTHLQTKTIHKEVLSDNISSSQTSVGVFNFIDVMDIEDVEECEEIVQNVNEIMSPFGRIESLRIVEDANGDIASSCEVVLRMKFDAIATPFMRSSSRNGGGSPLGDTSDSMYSTYSSERITDAVGKYIVVVTFFDSSAAWRAANGVNGMVFGGTPILTILFADGVVEKMNGDSSSLTSNSNSNSNSNRNENQYACNTDGSSVFNQTSSRGGRGNHDVSGGGDDGVSGCKYIVRLENFISIDDFEDEEEVDAILNDLVVLSSEYGALESVWIQNYDNNNDDDGDGYNNGLNNGINSKSNSKSNSNNNSDSKFNSCSDGIMESIDEVSTNHVGVEWLEFPFPLIAARRCISSVHLPLSIIQCPSLILALMIASHLSGKVVSSNVLRAYVCSDDDNFTNIRTIVGDDHDATSTLLALNRGFFYDVQQQVHNEGKVEGEEGGEEGGKEKQTFFALRLDSFVSEEELLDLEEKEQILQDLDVLQAGNDKYSLLFGRRPSPSAGGSSGGSSGGSVSSDSLDVIYIFNDLRDCLEVYKYYFGRVLGGRKVTPELLLARLRSASSSSSPSLSSIDGLECNLCVGGDGIGGEGEGSIDGVMTMIRRPGGGVLYVKMYEHEPIGLSIYKPTLVAPSLSYSVLVSGYISSEDLENASSSSSSSSSREEYEALKFDLLNLATSSSSLPLKGSHSNSTSSSNLTNSNVECVSRVTILGKEILAEQKSSSKTSSSSSSSSSYSVAYLSYKQRSHAEAVYCHFDERVFGGSKVSAYMEMETEKENEMDNTLLLGDSSLASGGSGRGRGRRALVTKALGESEVNKLNKRRSIAVLAAQSYASEEYTNNNSSSRRSIADGAVSGGGGGGGGYGDDGSGSIDELLLGRNGSMPRQPKHVAPIYTIPVADEETNAYAIKLLNDLARFQKKLIETEPIKAKSKLRFAVGFKQVYNSVKARRTILVLLAPDTETSGALDNKISDLVDEAVRNEIPVIYCLNRRKLAKSLDMSMRQSVVGIYKADGTFDNFKKIIEFISRNRRAIGGGGGGGGSK